MELHEFHVLQRQAGAKHDSASITGACMCRSAREIDSSVAARRKYHDLRAKPMQRTIHQRPCHDASAFAVHHHEVQYKILDKEFNAQPKRLSVECMDERVACAVRRRACARNGILTEVAHV